MMLCLMLLIEFMPAAKSFESGRQKRHNQCVIATTGPVRSIQIHGDNRVYWNPQRTAARAPVNTFFCRVDHQHALSVAIGNKFTA
jgi:hypothetical protein